MISGHVDATRPAPGPARSRGFPCAGSRPSAGGSRSPRRRPPRPAAAPGRIPRGRRGTSPERSLTVTGQPAAALAGGRRDPHRQVGVGEQGGAGAGLADLAHRAAHVDVDQVGAGIGDDLRGRAHHRRGPGRTAGPRPGARPGGAAAAPAGCARCGSAGRSSRPSRRRRGRRRAGGPAGARTSCRSRPAARAGRGSAISTSPMRNGCGEGRLHRPKCCAHGSAAGPAG